MHVHSLEKGHYLRRMGDILWTTQQRSSGVRSERRKKNARLKQCYYYFSVC